MTTGSAPTPVGLTRHAGWELSVRRTVPATPDEVWRRLLSEWLPAWLEVESVPQMVGAPLRGRGAVRGHQLLSDVQSRISVSYAPRTLDNKTVFQVTLQEAGQGTTIALHQERLLGAAERQAQLEHWTTVLEEVAAQLEAERPESQDLPG